MGETGLTLLHGAGCHWKIKPGRWLPLYKSMAKITEFLGGTIMKFNMLCPIRVMSLALLLACPAIGLACDDIEDGCLGCTDSELVACVDMLIVGLCEAGGGLEYCDTGRVRDDAERSILTNTGRHMSRIRAMARSAKKYQDRHRHRP